MTELPRVRPGREHVEQAQRDLRGVEEALARRVLPRGRRRHRAGPGRPRHRDAQRAHPGRDARGLPAHRPARVLQHLRGVRPRHRLDVQPARQVADHLQPPAVAGEDRVAEPAHHLDRLAAGPQRVHPPGPGLPRRGGEQERGRHPHLPAAGRELAAVGRRPLPAERGLHQRDRLRQAEPPAVPRHGRRRSPTAPRGSASGRRRAPTRAASRTW